MYSKGVQIVDSPTVVTSWEPRASQELGNLCDLCNGHGSFDVVFPEKFRGMLVELSQEHGHNELFETQVAIACGCNWWSWADFMPSQDQYALGYLDVAAVVLGRATDQQWYNVLGNSTDRGTGIEILEKWAVALGLSTDGLV